MKLTNRMASSAHHVFPKDICPNTVHHNVCWHSARSLLLYHCVCMRPLLRPLRLRVVLRLEVVHADASREVVRERHHIASQCSPGELTVRLGYCECRAVGSLKRINKLLITCFC